MVEMQGWMKILATYSDADRLSEMEIIEKLEESERDIQNGDIMDAEEALLELKTEFNL